MADRLTIALDAMGGDHAPDVVLDGTVLARERYPGTHFLLFGDRHHLEPAVERRRTIRQHCDIIHTDQVIGPDMKPSQALRKGRESSMGMAITSVKEGKAEVAVSGGNTGAMMALSKFILRMMPGIDRPALVSLMPTARGESAMLDLGANVECDSDNLVQFAIMGAAYARIVLGLSRPRVRLLNIGTEELKGNEEIKAAADILKNADLPLEFDGFIEGDGIGEGAADVIVTDGFTGNIALKTAEGTAVLVSSLMRSAFRNSPISMLGYLLARGGLKSLRHHLDPNTHNGGMFIGLNGLVVKSHGGSNAAGFASAIGVAHDMAKGGLLDLIGNDMTEYTCQPATPPASELQTNEEV